MSLSPTSRFSTTSPRTRVREILDTFDSVTEEVRTLGSAERGRIAMKRAPLSWFNTNSGMVTPVRYLTDGCLEFNARGQLRRMVASVTHGRNQLSYSMAKKDDGSSIYTVWGRGHHEQVQVNANGTVDYFPAGIVS